MSIAKLTRYGLPFAAVAANAVTTNQITPGRTIENIQLKLGGTTFTKAMITAYKSRSRTWSASPNSIAPSAPSTPASASPT